MKTEQAEEPITEYGQLDPNGSYTYADYLKWVFTDRVELIGGKLFKMSPAPGTNHQAVSRELSLQVFTFFNNSSCQAFSAPFDVRLPLGRKKGEDTTVVQPDLCVICDPAKLDERGCQGAPDLVVEILSPGNSRREMKEKFEVYEASGVREYWLVHPLDKLVLIYVLDERGTFIGLPPVVEGEVFRSAIFPDLEIDLKSVFP
jgi:Uma2 family endonuclease